MKKKQTAKVGNKINVKSSTWSFGNDVYKTLLSATSRYLLICEYYNPVPVKVVYRNFKNKLFKRDFAGDLIKKIR